MKIRNTLLTSLAALTAAGTVAAGATQAAAAPARSHGRSLVNVNIGISASAADQVIPFYAEKAGIFQQFGINANVTLTPSTELVAGVTGGSLQYGVFGAPQPEEAIAAGAPLRWIAVWADRPDLEFIVQPGITSFKQLIGKPVGGTAAGALTQILAQSVLSRHGVPTNEVRWVNLGTPPLLLGGFVSHQIDAFVTGPPISNVALAKDSGAHPLLDLATSYQWPFAGFGANADYAKHHRQVTENLLKAMNLALIDWRRHPSQAESVIQQETNGATSSEAVAAYKSSLPSLNKNLVPNLTAEVAVLKTLRATDPAIKGMRATQFIDTSYLKAAGLLGGNRSTKAGSKKSGKSGKR